MKLYATVTSERASKGQGGNNHLDIDVFIGSAKNSVKILEGSIKKEGEGYTVYVTTIGQGDNDQCIDTFIKEKGEKQKGGNLVSCESCGSQYEYYTEPKEVKEGGEHICSDCWNNPE